MNLKEHYNKLYTESVAKIEADNYEIDSLIDANDDSRFGITLLIRPDERTKANIQQFLNEIKAIEPHQYYYQNPDIHITVMSIISCYSGFNLTKINIEDYIEVVKQVLIKHKSFSLQLKGLTASPSCILLQGFFSDNTLNEIRDQLRLSFKNSTLQQSLDQRYVLQTAHSTIIRFREVLNNKAGFLAIVEKYKDFNFGTFEIKNLELVYNDWYQRAQFVQKLYDFEL